MKNKQGSMYRNLSIQTHWKITVPFCLFFFSTLVMKQINIQQVSEPNVLKTIINSQHFAVKVKRKRLRKSIAGKMQIALQIFMSMKSKNTTLHAFSFNKKNLKFYRWYT